MDPTASDQRKFRCLVAALKKEGLTELEQLTEQHALIVAGHSFDMVRLAIEASRNALMPRWEKQIKKLVGPTNKWSPKAEAQWTEFEEMREQIMGSSMVIYERSCITWSPVEMWTVSKFESLYHVQSMLSGESWYVHRGGLGRNPRMIEGGCHQDLPKNRNAMLAPLGRISVNRFSQMPEDKKMEIPNLISTIIYKSIFCQ